MKFRYAAGVVGVIVFFILFYGALWTHCSWFARQSPLLSTNIDVLQIADAQETSGLHHLACIMDGNRRWAKKRGLEPWEGHREGIAAAKRVVEFCIEKKIKYLSLYTFSPENFKRSDQEINYLFDLMMQEAQKGIEEFKKHDIRLRFIGDRSLFPAQLAPLLDQFEKETAHCDTLHLTFLFCYGGRQEIAAAAKSIAHKLKAGEIKEEEITPEAVSAHLWTRDLPDPDLIIRTGAVARLSNFLLFQAAYSELYMLDCFWPDISKEHLQQAYDAFLHCKRNFGT